MTPVTLDSLTPYAGIAKYAARVIVWVCLAIWATAMVYASTQADHKTVADHEERLRQLEPAIIKIRTDVEWMRREWEKGNKP